MKDLATRLSSLSPEKQELLARQLQKRQNVAEPIAIVGMACRFPGASGLEQYWQIIRDGIDTTKEIPSSRWDAGRLYDPTGEEAGKMSVKWAGMLDEIDRFDPQFFGISPREAVRMDPQQRLLLEVAWESLEVAGIPATSLAGTRTGFFVGIGGSDYSKIPSQFEDYYQLIDAHVGTGNALSIAANRLSYIFDCHGPSMAVDTACSSSTMAIHLAVQSLRNRECTMALAGGVNAILTPETTIAFSKAKMLSPDGRCRPFDAAANGYVRSEGCGLIVLKRLSDATAAGDTIIAVIRASAANQDGRTSGITAPSGPAQQAVIRSALQQAELQPSQIGYIEAHGTGTPLGDPIEMEALAEVFRSGKEDDPPCFVTSVKANVGHMETVSGVAGIIKVALMMQHGVIPAQLHFQSLNPGIHLQGSRLVIPRGNLAWTSTSPRFAGVSSFGFGGTNTHTILEKVATRPQQGEDSSRPFYLLALSARSESSLAKLAELNAETLDSDKVTIDQLAHTLAAGRVHHPVRGALVVRDRQQATTELRGMARGLRNSTSLPGVRRSNREPRVAFLFTGQGSQYFGMGRALFQTFPLFRETMQACDRILRDELQESLLTVMGLTQHDAAQEVSDRLIHDTRFTQPALFALEYALATLWQDWGVRPSIVLGHSVGEYVAACIAGVMTLEEGLHLIAQRARCMASLPPGGAMAAVLADEATTGELLKEDLRGISIAAVNSPENTVVSGSAEAVQQFLERCRSCGINGHLLEVSHGFHSALMDPILDEFERAASRVAFRRPNVTLVSNLTGQVIDHPLDARYLRDHLRATVRFQSGMEAAAQQQADVMLEIGPTATLSGFGRRGLPNFAGPWLPSLRTGQPDLKVMLSALAELYLHGAKINWRQFEQPWKTRRAILPTYPFERQRLWFETAGFSPRRTTRAEHRSLPQHPLLGRSIATPLATKVFTSRISRNSPSYLADHQVQGSVVVPAAAYVELGLAAARAAASSVLSCVEQLSIQHPLFLPEQGECALQVVVTPESSGRSSFECFSRRDDAPEGQWVLHATGMLTRPAPAEELSGHGAVLRKVDVGAVRARLKRKHDRREFYEDLMRSRRLQYGAAFQVFCSVGRNDCETLTEVQLEAGVRGDLHEYVVHPVLGDALLQAAAGIIPFEKDGSYSAYTYMPIAIERVQVYAPITDKMFVYGIRTSSDDTPSPNLVEGDFSLVDEDGRVLVEFRGVRLKRLGRERRADGDRLANLVYRLGWIPFEELPQGAREMKVTGIRRERSCLIFADQGGVATGLAGQIRAAGGDPLLVYAPGRQSTSGQPHVDWREQEVPVDDEAAIKRLLESIAGHDELTDVVHLWSLDAVQPSDSDLCVSANRALAAGCGSILRILRGLGQNFKVHAPRVWLVTRGAQQVLESDCVEGVAQSPLWGLGRVAAMEHREFRVSLVDLDPSDDGKQQAKQLFHDFDIDFQPQQVAYRAGQRWVPRLQRETELNDTGICASNRNELKVPRNCAFRLGMGDSGTFDSLLFEPFSRQPPGQGQIEIAVESAGLNFSDILKVMGLYPGSTDRIVPLGIECAGIVTAVGKSVSRFSVGDSVFGVAPFSLSTHARTAEHCMVRKPDELSFAEAASLPIVFLTAHYGLVRLAQLQPGERILVHAGAGGVGLAAIQIAQLIGAEVFATAGSEVKRSYLQSLGVSHILNSRNMEFAEEIMSLTRGEGIDVVLNSLPGDAIPLSLGLLRSCGRFLEIGKTDIYQNRMIGLAPFRDNLSFFAIDLDRLLRQRPDQVRCLLEEIIDHVQKKAYRPVNLTVFQSHQTIDAFRFMAKRQNIGKVVISIAEPESHQGGRQTRADSAKTAGTCLISGGLGALGIRVAQRLAYSGVKNLVLLGRSRPDAHVAAAIAGLKEAGCRVALLQADVADLDGLKAALAAMPENLPPLRGVIHAAGVLADGLLYDMDDRQFCIPWMAKVNGALNLHLATADQPLDYFVMFSSVASLLGSPGQGNYAAANAFLDSFAGWRRSRGLPATTINWGPWAEAGMAVQTAGGAQIASRGMNLLSPEDGLEVLARSLGAGPANFSVMDVDWEILAQSMGNTAPELICQFTTPRADLGSREAQVDRNFLKALRAADPGRREKMLIRFFTGQLAHIMGLDAADLDTTQPLSQLGMDSLLGMELRNNVEQHLGVVLPMSAFMDTPTLAKLAAHVARLFENELTVESGNAGPPAPDSLSTWSPLVVIQESNAGAPLVLLHPLGGDLACYLELLPHFERRQAIYGLRGKGSSGLQAPDASWDELIDSYLCEIKKARPSGSLVIAGWSAGGIFAYELSRRLRQANVEISALILIETPVPRLYANLDLDDRIGFLAEYIRFVNLFLASELEISEEYLRKVPEDEAFALVLSEARRKRVVSATASPEIVRSMVDTARQHACFVKSYSPFPVSHPVYLIRADIRDKLGFTGEIEETPDLGWNAILHSRLSLHTAAGDHFSMLKKPHAKTLVDTIQTIIDSSTLPSA